MIPIWLHLPVVFALAGLCWIAGMDATGNAIEASLLWTLTALAAGHLVFRLLRSAR